MDTFSIHHRIVADDITEITCDFNYDDSGYDTVLDAVNAKINNMMEWLNNEGHMLFLD